MELSVPLDKKFDLFRTHLSYSFQPKVCTITTPSTIENPTLSNFQPGTPSVAQAGGGLVETPRSPLMPTLRVQPTENVPSGSRRQLLLEHKIPEGPHIKTIGELGPIIPSVVWCFGA